MTNERTPLRPVIAYGGSHGSKLCNCCHGALDVVAISFGWVEWPDEVKKPNGGATSVSLCRACRGILRAVLDEPGLR